MLLYCQFRTQNGMGKMSVCLCLYTNNYLPLFGYTNTQTHTHTHETPAYRVQVLGGFPWGGDGLHLTLVHRGRAQVRVRVRAS